MQTVNIPVQNNASAGLIEFLVEFFRPNIVEDRQKFPNTSIANICTKNQITKRPFFCNILISDMQRVMEYTAPSNK